MKGFVIPVAFKRMSLPLQDSETNSFVSVCDAICNKSLSAIALEILS